MTAKFLSGIFLLLLVCKGESLECYVGVYVNGAGDNTKIACAANQVCYKSKIETKLMTVKTVTETLSCMTSDLSGPLCQKSNVCATGLTCEISCCATDRCNNGIVKKAGFMSLVIALFFSLVMIMY